jgi:16S rRNA (guanine1207-N2)-methyltransferase
MAEHYFSEKQTSHDKRFEVEIKLRGDSFTLISSKGVFSKDELDDATALLIKHAITGEKVLDLGCGYGVVGICILRKNKDIEMTFSDVNERALELTSENLKKLNLKGTIVKSNLFENIQDTFDAILSNPPISAGRKTCYSLIEEAYAHLESRGTLQIVARHNKGGSMLRSKMEEVFGNVTTIVKNKGFHVYLSRKE